MARINLISNDNGVGLTRDVELLEAFLKSRGHWPRVCDWRNVAMLPKADLAIHIEILNPANIASAHKNVGIFNLEWFEPDWEKHLEHLDQIWAKSSVAFEWFMERGHDQVRCTSFQSRDMGNSATPKLLRVLHVRGASMTKGTETVFEAYKLAGNYLPPLTVVTRDPIEGLPHPNVELVMAPSDGNLRELMNSHRIHLCPSIVEGWGHHINEALSCRSIVVTTDASPMNEHVMPSFGRLLPVIREGYMRGATTSFVEPNAIITTLHEVCRLPLNELHRMGVRAREWFLSRNAAFEQHADKLLAALGLQA